jgi:hypothetical protein
MVVTQYHAALASFRAQEAALKDPGSLKRPKTIRKFGLRTLFETHTRMSTPGSQICMSEREDTPLGMLFEALGGLHALRVTTNSEPHLLHSLDPQE